MGGAVLKGGFTTFLGTLILSFTSSLIFRTFFKLLFSTVVLGVLHGLYFAPVALRVRRPRHSRASGREKDDTSSARERMRLVYASTSLLAGSDARPAAALGAQTRPGERRPAEFGACLRERTSNRRKLSPPRVTSRHSKSNATVLGA